MRKIHIKSMNELESYPNETKIEIYGLNETSFSGDRDRALYNNDGELLIVDDGGGFLVDDSFLRENKVVVCLAESLAEEKSEKIKHLREAISPKLRVEILMRDNSRCALCGTTAKRARMEIDHIIPVSKGGTNDPTNLQVLCVTCNQGKGAR